MVVNNYPSELLDFFAPPGDDLPWMYTGALENYPTLLERLAAERPLWGNRADVVRRARDPWQLRAVLERAAIPSPPIRAPADPPPPGERWLTKSPHSSGGSGVHDWPSRDGATIDPAVYLQQHVAGAPTSATFVAAGGRCRLLGTSQQLIGTGWAGADGYRYVGSLASRDVPPQTTAQFVVIGDVLAEAFQLTGLFGVDAILANTTIWPIEVNPRYTASVEVIERVTGIAALDLHVRACRDGQLPEVDMRFDNIAPGASPCAGKAILFARNDVVVSDALSDHIASLNNTGDWPTVADVPKVGTSIPTGAPVLTVLATSTDFGSVQEQLQHTALELESLLSSR